MQTHTHEFFVKFKWEKKHFIFLRGTKKGKERNFLLKVNAKLALSCKVVDGPCVLYSYWVEMLQNIKVRKNLMILKKYLCCDVVYRRLNKDTNGCD